MQEGTWLGHPRGLTVLFLTEMWADFSYFGMRALLVYYMTTQLHLGIAAASTIYGAYTASAHLTPIAGGVLADRWLGKRVSVASGAAIMALGHFMMTFPALFFPALATVAVGFGLFLPSLPSQVVSLYPEGDPRLDRAYSVYYVGINLGSFLAPIVCGTLGERYGWHVGFAAAGVGMLIGLAVYVAGSRWLPEGQGRVRGEATEPAQGEARAAAPGGLLAHLRPLMGELAVLAVAVILFRIAYEQIGNSIALWTESGVDREIAAFGGFTVPMTWFQSLNPLAIFALTPLVLRRWRRLSSRGREPGSVAKMAGGAWLLAAAFASIAAAGAISAGRVPWLALVLFMLLLTLGEICFMPIGLSLVTRLAPRGHRATLLGGWFILAFFANFAAGVLGREFAVWRPVPFFAVCAGLAAAAGLVLHLGSWRRLSRR
ncbi:MAG TPA: peptide MFS transporter [Steroidobacteraceae bacterium]|nr:peptide MFS transporter [Steroidobacteraceae bacterium]